MEIKFKIIVFFVIYKKSFIDYKFCKIYIYIKFEYDVF